MSDVAITVMNMRPQFYTKAGRAQKEYMVTLDESLKNSGISLSKDRFKRSYEKQLAYTVMASIAKDAYAHHENFLRVKFQGAPTLYGFSKKRDYIENSLIRVSQRAEKAKEIERKVNEVTGVQLQLLT